MCFRVKNIASVPQLLVVQSFLPQYIPLSRGWTRKSNVISTDFRNFVAVVRFGLAYYTYIPIHLYKNTLPTISNKFLNVSLYYGCVVCKHVYICVCECLCLCVRLCVRVMRTCVRALTRTSLHALINFINWWKYYFSWNQLHLALIWCEI